MQRNDSGHCDNIPCFIGASDPLQNFHLTYIPYKGITISNERVKENAMKDIQEFLKDENQPGQNVK